MRSSRDNFNILCHEMQKRGVVVRIQSRDYMAYAFWSTKNKVCNGFIMVAEDQSWEQRLIVLAHEIGHLFSVSKEAKSKKSTFAWSPSSSEVTANRRAKAILDKISPSLIPKYVDYYNTIYMRSRERKSK